jgi:CubicO group peptidase (beta-lactamase class C family)
MGKNIKYFAGVDPGKRGAFSIVDQKSRLVEYWLMGELYDMRLKLLPYIDNLSMIALEKAQAMARHGQTQGASSMFTYGMGYGKLLGLFETLGLKYEEIRPLQWMQKMFVTWETGTSKEMSKKLCAAMHPDDTFIPYRCRKVHDGLTDATCLAHYARRFLQ